MKRLLALLLSLVLMAGFLVPAAAGDLLIEQDAPAADDISVTAYAAYLMDMDTGVTLYQYKADEKNYPASTTKIMTAYLCLKYGDAKDIVTVKSSAFEDLSQAASTGNLVVGETMSVHRLLQSLLVVSASEAANVVAEYISGSREKFVDLMNQEAQELGCTGTHFANCHGLPNSDHYTTARDLAIIAQAAMEYEEFREIVGSAVTTLAATNVHGTQQITSTNGVLPGSSYPGYSYPYAIGIKTGHTSVAGYCLVSAADKDGQRLLCVVMGCGSRTASFSQTVRLFEWGYENYEALTYGMDVPDPELPDESDNQDSTLEEAEPMSVQEAAAPPPTPTILEVPTAPVSAEEPELSPSPSIAPAVSSNNLVPILIVLIVAAVLIVILIVIAIVLVIRR